MGLDKNIARVEKLDEHRVKFTLNEVDAAFIQNLAMDVASIQSAEYAGQLLEAGKPQQINQKPIGTGPFILSRYQKDAQIRFKGNKDYWNCENHYIHSFELENGRIKRNREFMNPMQKLRALGIAVPQIKRDGIPT